MEPKIEELEGKTEQHKTIEQIMYVRAKQRKK